MHDLGSPSQKVLKYSAYLRDDSIKPTLKIIVGYSSQMGKLIPTYLSLAKRLVQQLKMLGVGGLAAQKGGR